MFRRLMTVGGATLASAVLLVGSSVGGRAQVPGVVLPSNVSVPPESALPLSDLTAFTGEANISSDNCNQALGVVPCQDSPEGDSPAMVDLVGGGGSFVFNSIACAGVSDPNGDPLGSPVAEGGTV